MFWVSQWNTVGVVSMWNTVGIRVKVMEHCGCFG